MNRRRPQRPDVACAAPGCDRPVHQPTTRGRPPIYCSPACRAAVKCRPHNRPVLVEVDHPPLDTRDRPAGRIWQVTLRRGDRAVTVATDLGRTTADDLANRIAALLRARSAQQGGAIN